MIASVLGVFVFFVFLLDADRMLSVAITKDFYLENRLLALHVAMDVDVDVDVDVDDDDDDDDGDSRWPK
ncbi:hypothetical protein ACLKA7_005997 [Drosophila subpalustris]